MLKLLERIITEKTPYQITTTSNSLEVPEILENRSPFDLIITDLKMPGMDGLDILRLVKEQKRFEEVIIITAFGSLETAIEALSLGVFDYITKPFKKEQIIFTVNRAMRWQQMKREAPDGSDVRPEPCAEARQAFEREYVSGCSRSDAKDDRTLDGPNGSGMTQEALAATLEQPTPRG